MCIRDSNEGEVPILLEGDEDLDHIILETGSNILMEDGYRVLNEDQGFVSSGLKDRLLLERGGIVMAESDRFSFPIGFVVDENENLILEDHHSDHDTISFNDFGDFRFEDILRPNKLTNEGVPRAPHKPKNILTQTSVSWCRVGGGQFHP